MDSVHTTADGAGGANGPSPQADLSDLEIRVLRVLEQHGTQNAIEISSRLGLSVDSVLEALHQLAGRGIVEGEPEPVRERFSVDLAALQKTLA